MINPILIVITVAVFLSAAVITIINRPKVPVIAGALLLILIFFLFTTFSIDHSLTEMADAGVMNQLVCFAVMNDRPSYELLESSFTLFSIIDVGLFVASLVAMFIETLMILHKNSKM